MVTYADIQRIYRGEKASPQLQDMGEDFYSGCRELVGKVDDQHREHVVKLCREVFEKRRNKIVAAALRMQEKEPSFMTCQEKIFYDSLRLFFTSYEGEVLSGKSSEGAGAPAVPAAGVEKVGVRFLRSLPSIIGVDMVHYGPFNEGDFVELPLENAKILIENEIAEEE